MRHNMKLDFDKMDGLLPAIAQDLKSGKVLMLGFMNEEAYRKTIESGCMTFYSRTRQRLWTKGESSGNTLKVQSWSSDCDQDTLLFQVEANGPTCHLGETSCFRYLTQAKALAFLGQLEDIIELRRSQNTDSSYTAKLLNSDPRRLAQKIGEEGVETALAMVSGTREECIEESADLIFHLMLGLRSRGIGLSEVSACLEQRHEAQNRAQNRLFPASEVEVGHRCASSDQTCEMNLEWQDQPSGSLPL